MESNLRKILDRISTGICVVESQGYKIIYFNKEFLSIFKNKLKEKKDLRCYELLWNSSYPCLNCPIHYLSENLPKLELCYAYEADKCLHIEYSYFSEKEFLISVKDLKREDPYRSILLEVLEKLPVAIVFCKGRKILYLNKFSEEAFGYKKNELIGGDFVDLLVAEEDKLKVEVYLRNGAKNVMLSFKTKRGETRTFLCSFFHTHYWQYESITVIAGIDITEFIEIKNKIEKIHKNESFSNFLRGLIHDFNNVLQSLNNYLEAIKLNLHDSEKVKEYVELTEKSLTSWIDLNRLLLDYTKETKSAIRKKIEILNFLKENLELFQFILGENILLRIDFNYLSNVWIPGDTSLWRYIFLNLLSNAKDAIEREGVVEIILRTYTEGEDNKKCLVIAIKDTGCGIDEDDLSKIFQPFYTTKQKGSGLGLFLIKNHLESLGGKIEVESKPGKGTTFKLFIPILSYKKIFNSASAKNVKSAKILLVEDDDESREMIKSFLKKEGYEVKDFKTGEEVLKEFGSITDVEMLLIDLNLPGMKGIEIYEILKIRCPDLKVIYLTGDPLSLADLPKDQILLKPFKMEELLNKLNEQLSKC